MDEKTMKEIARKLSVKWVISPDLSVEDVIYEGMKEANQIKMKL